MLRTGPLFGGGALGLGRHERLEALGFGGGALSSGLIFGRTDQFFQQTPKLLAAPHSKLTTLPSLPTRITVGMPMMP